MHYFQPLLVQGDADAHSGACSELNKLAASEETRAAIVAGAGITAMFAAMRSHPADGSVQRYACDVLMLLVDADGGGSDRPSRGQEKGHVRAFMAVHAMAAAGGIPAAFRALRVLRDTMPPEDDDELEHEDF